MGAAASQDTVLPEGEALPPLESKDLDGIAKYINAHAKRIIVMAGAGISTAAGIPDFRTPGTGLYDNLQKYGLPQPEAIFELGYFFRNPAPFYDLVKEMWPGNYRPTASHFFIKLLADKGLLVRAYTQNIDSLESAAGLDRDLVVAAHGNFDSCHVVRPGEVGQEVSPEELRAALVEGGEGWEALRDRHGGLVKPDIVFFGESLPGRFFTLLERDLPKCDLLIVMGTSLKVQPFSMLINYVPPTCPRLLINREMVGIAQGFTFLQEDNVRDVFHESSCDDGVLEMSRLLGWEGELAGLMNDYRPQAKPAPASPESPVSQ